MKASTKIIYLKKNHFLNLRYRGDTYKKNCLGGYFLSNALQLTITLAELGNIANVDCSFKKYSTKL